jgi:hypothetical protein
MCQSNIKEAQMFTPMSITSLNQGKDLAHWHIRRLYGESLDPDIHRSEAGTEVAIPVATGSNTAQPERRPFLAISIWCQKATRKIIPRHSHGKDCESPAT